MQGVPSQYIKTAPVDWGLEFIASSGGQLRVGGAVLPAASFGVWAMLELIDCDFLHPQKEPTAGGAVVATYLTALGRDALPLVQEYLDNGHDGVALDMDDDSNIGQLGTKAMEWVIANDIEPDDFLRVRDWLNVAFAGFGMVPGSGGGGEQVFGIDNFGAIVSAVGADFGVPVVDLMWKTPLCVVGHAVAQKSKQSGAKGVARPKDRQHMKEQFEAAKHSHDNGLLYEWQEKEPLRYDLDGHETADEAYRYAVLQHEARTKGAV